MGCLHMRSVRLLRVRRLRHVRRRLLRVRCLRDVGSRLLRVMSRWLLDVGFLHIFGMVLWPRVTLSIRGVLANLSLRRTWRLLFRLLLLAFQRFFVSGLFLRGAPSMGWLLIVLQLGFLCLPTLCLFCRSLFLFRNHRWFPGWFPTFRVFGSAIVDLALILLRLLCVQLLLFYLLLACIGFISGLFNERLQFAVRPLLNVAIGPLLNFRRSAWTLRFSLRDCLNLGFAR